MRLNSFLLIVTFALFVFGCKHKDTTPPIIYLQGDNPMTTILQKLWEDPGAKADDNFDGDISNKIEVTHNIPFTTGTPNGDGVTREAGRFNVVYKVADKEGNESTRTRVVNVVNQSAKYATRYEYSKIGGTSVFPNFIGKEINLDYDKRTNNRIIFPRVSDRAGLRIYGDVVNDSLIVMEAQFRVINDNQIDYLYRVRGVSGESKVLDNIWYKIQITYTIDKYVTSTVNDYQYQHDDGTYWKFISNSTNTEIYERL